MNGYFIDGTGDNLGRTIEVVSTERVVLGRKVDNVAHKIDNEKVSSKHCSLFIVNGAMVIEDNSKNGTFINGTNLSNSEQPLQHGDVISLLSTVKWPDHKNVQFSVRLPGSHKTQLSTTGDQTVKKQKIDTPCDHCGKQCTQINPQCGICLKNCCSETVDSCIDNEGDSIVLLPPQDHKFASIPEETFGGNSTEIEILSNYVRDNNVSLDSKWSTHAACHLNSLVPICSRCAGKEFSNCLFDYTISIKSALPNEVIIREDCWYGKDCRTQHHNPAHAMRLNHVCLNTGSPSKK